MIVIVVHTREGVESVFHLLVRFGKVGCCEMYLVEFCLEGCLVGELFGELCVEVCYPLAVVGLDPLELFGQVCLRLGLGVIEVSAASVGE